MANCVFRHRAWTCEIERVQGLFVANDGPAVVTPSEGRADDVCLYDVRERDGELRLDDVRARTRFDRGTEGSAAYDEPRPSA